MARLRPVKLETIADGLRHFYYRYQGAQLVRIVPGVADGILPDDWPDWLSAVLRQVEAWDWFEVDWDLLDSDYEAWMMSDEEDYFSQWLEFIPIQRFGFSDYDENWPEQYPPMALLKALLHGDWGEDILIGLLDDYGLEADWPNIFQWELEKRLVSADFSGYEPPLCWLPEIAKIACGITGHELLDFSNHYEDYQPAYRWDTDLDRLKELYQTARPSVLHLREFLHWCNGPGEMQAVVDALVGERPARAKRGRKKKASQLNTLIEILTPEAQ